MSPGEGWVRASLMESGAARATHRSVASVTPCASTAARTPSAVSAAPAAHAHSTSSKIFGSRRSHRVKTTPEKAKPSMVSEITRNAKLLRSLAETIRWTRI
jgi:hypothetical protein